MTSSPVPALRRKGLLVDRFVKAFESADIEQVVDDIGGRREAGDATRAHRVPRPAGGRRVLQVLLVLGPTGQARPNPSQLPTSFWLLPLGHVPPRLSGATGSWSLPSREDRVSSITRFGGPGVLARFDLPAMIDP